MRRERGAQGGYICRLEHLSALEPTEVARAALREDGLSLGGWSVVIACAPRRNLARVSFEHDGHEQTATWYREHHALASLLSRAHASAVHVYVFVPFDTEEVVAYGGGRRVGGERVDFANLELEDVELNDDARFERARSRWPLGHLAQILGVTRTELLGLRGANAEDVMRQPLSRQKRRKSA